ncbi:hypothetical protein F2Q70_00025653 [Brassica cretica]|uniref:Uncharacterized protein n=1 Tax=Brassica cretica TaxID=69181 RepID=A0A8S9LE36_BRACR|nr:hypothetical protein F2Q70_00025653 [Brassica cretica]
MAMKPNGKSHVSFANDEKVMFFKDVSPGPHETQLQLPSDPFLGGSKASKKDTYCPVNAPHRRTGLRAGTIKQNYNKISEKRKLTRVEVIVTYMSVKSYHGSESSCAIWLETKNTFTCNLAREGPQGNNTHVTTAKVARHGYTKPLSMFKHAICGLREIFIAGVCSTRS